MKQAFILCKPLPVIQIYFLKIERNLPYKETMSMRENPINNPEYPPISETMLQKNKKNCLFNLNT